MPPTCRMLRVEEICHFEMAKWQSGTRHATHNFSAYNSKSSSSPTSSPTSRLLYTDRLHLNFAEAVGVFALGEQFEQQAIGKENHYYFNNSVFASMGKQFECYGSQFVWNAPVEHFEWEQDEIINAWLHLPHRLTVWVSRHFIVCKEIFYQLSSSSIHVCWMISGIVVTHIQHET